MIPFLPRCGDRVFHRPSRETWRVAWAEGDCLAWEGWPNGIASLSDCLLVYRCTDHEHRAAIERWEQSRSSGHESDSRRARVLRLYGARAAA